MRDTPQVSRILMIAQGVRNVYCPLVTTNYVVFGTGVWAFSLKI